MTLEVTMSEDATTAAAPEAASSVPAEGADAQALSQAAAVEPTVEAPVEAPVEDEVDLDADAADDLYADPAKARAYAEKLRKEAAKYRTKAKEAAVSDETFSGWSDEDAGVLKQVIQVAALDPKVGAAKMREIADLLDKGDAEGAAAVAADASAEAAKVLTEDDVNAKVAEALEKADTKRAIEVKRDEILAKTKALGYEPGSPDYFTVLHIAQFETGADLDKAHEIIEARNQAIIDGYVNGVKERAAGAPLHARRGEESVIEPTGENKTWASARERTEARINAVRQGEQK